MKDVLEQALVLIESMRSAWWRYDAEALAAIRAIEAERDAREVQARVAKHMGNVRTIEHEGGIGADVDVKPREEQRLTCEDVEGTPV